MKKILLLVSFLSLGIKSFACAICGCGSGNLYMGLLPDFKSHFIGVRYHYSYLHTTLASDPSQFSHNYYNSIELWGGVNIGQKFQVLAFVPYYINRQVDDDGITTPHGLGDITVIGQYNVFHSINFTAGKNMIEQNLWLGIGVKAPTGSFKTNVDDPDATVADINAQLGTGSTDFLLNGLYNIRINDFGVNASASYQINTTNGQDYHYGNKLNTNLIAFYRIGIHKVMLSPNAGLGYEKVEGNLLHNAKVEFTGSNVTNTIAGVELNLKKIGVGLNAQLPIRQNFAEGQTKLKFKSMLHITFGF